MEKDAKKPKKQKTERPTQAQLTPEESLKRTKEFYKRKEAFVAAARKGKD